MGLVFQHTAIEPGLWRGWLQNGQSVEISWGRRCWQFGAGVHIHSNDDDRGDRMLFLRLWRLTIVLPLGVINREYVCGDEPKWSAYATSEFGVVFNWGRKRKQFDLPWFPVTLAYEQMLPDGSWRSVFDDVKPYTERHAYTYVLRDGTVQERTATISKRRHVLTFAGSKWIGWPRWIRESIDVQFSGEVGERSGSWKGGCIGCGYDLRPDERMVDALRRMERDRKF